MISKNGETYLKSPPEESNFIVKQEEILLHLE